jgi:hypothetical protein
MPTIEVRTRLYPRRLKRGERRDRLENDLLMEILLHPRGSGNRNLARSLARAAKNHPQLGPHVRSVRAGSSKVWVTLIPSLALTKTLATWNAKREQLADVPGQLPLFG